MSVGITLAEAQVQLALWLAASAGLASSQSYEIETNGVRRSLTRADAAEVRRNIEFWDGKVQALSVAGTGRRRTRYMVPE